MSPKSRSCTVTYNWANLPKELLEKIGQHLEIRVQVFRFRAVCASWRSARPLSMTHQSSHSPNTSISTAVEIYRLEDEARSRACLIKVVESSSGNVHLLNVLSIPQSNSNPIKRSINVLEFRLVELTRGCYVKPHFSSLEFDVKRGVLFNQRAILAVSFSGKLGLRRFRHKKWTVLGDEMMQYDDVVVYKGQYYVVDNWGIVSWIDNESLNLVQFSPPLYGTGHLKHLIESGDHLYVVDGYFSEDRFRSPRRAELDEYRRINRLDEIVDMRVYMLDEEWGKWVDVHSLGDRVFVLAKECCFSVSVDDFPGCQGNCIYFMEPKVVDENRRFVDKPYVPRVFGLDDRSVKSAPCFPVHMRLFSPEWMKSCCSTSSLP